MVDLTIVPANVIAAGNAVKEAGTAGETIAAGKAVYKSSTTGKWMLADDNSATQEARRAGGVALNGASLNQPVDVCTSGKIAIGATVVAGAPYYVSDTAGGICPQADVGTGETVCQIGLAASTTELVIDIQFPGVTL